MIRFNIGYIIYLEVSEFNIFVTIVGYKYVGEAMKPFHDRGYLDVFAVGVGLKNDKAIKEVKDMVKSQEKAILPNNYKELTETVESFIRMFCPGKIAHAIMVILIEVLFNK